MRYSNVLFFFMFIQFISSADQPHLSIIGKYSTLSNHESIQLSQWYILSVVGNELTIKHPTKIIPSPMIKEFVSHEGENQNTEVNTTKDSTFDFMGNDICAINLDKKGDYLSLRQRKVPSLIPPMKSMKIPSQINYTYKNTTHTLTFTGMKNENGTLLIGSERLSLLSYNRNTIPTKSQRTKKYTTDTTILVPQPAGLYIKSYALIWYGDLNNDDDFDLILKRTLITDEVQFVVRIAGKIAVLEEDYDFPIQEFSSGIDESSEINYYPWNKPSQLSVDNKGEFIIPNSLLTKFTKNIPSKIVDTTVIINKEKLILSLEYIPKLISHKRHTSSNLLETHTSPTILYYTYKGIRSALLELSYSDNMPNTIQFGITAKGLPLLTLHTMVNYNNSTYYQWVWNNTKKRFVRHLISHGQGC